MSDDLYQQAIIDLAKRSRQQVRLEQPDRSATIDNPLCGDRITLDLALDGDRVTAVGHKTRGCLLCEASACLIAEEAPGRSLTELEEQAARLVRSFADQEQPLAELWPGLETLAPARRYKSRLECVTLPFHGLMRALDADGKG
ncbi:MAG: iron-sulfur cluster assembly scaffold protein [Alphaproteobacteria bacterium]